MQLSEPGARIGVPYRSACFATWDMRHRIAVVTPARGARPS